MKKHLSILIGITFFLSLKAQNSTFDNSTEGWIILGDTQNIPPIWQSTGGNPGGWAKGVDQSVGGVWYYQAPQKFLGEKCDAYGKTLSFDIKTNTLAGGYSREDVMFQGGGLTIVFDFPNNPTLNWTRYQVKLDETANWRLNTVNGPKATKAQILQVLSDITLFKIRGEFAQGADDEGGLDNVVLPSFPFAFDLDKNNSSKAIGRDYNSDTICGINSLFRLADLDLSLSYAGVIDSIVVSSPICAFQCQNNFPSFTMKGQNTSRLLLKSQTLSDSLTYKSALFSTLGIVKAPPKAPSFFEVAVTVYIGACQHEAICRVFVINNLILDLDKNNSTLAQANDYNGDTLCINDNRFNICDIDVSLFIPGIIDSIVIAPTNNIFRDYILTSSYTAPNIQVNGLNSNKLIIIDKVSNDTSELKKFLLSINGILQNGIKPPAEFKISVKAYQGGCSVEAIGTIRTLIRYTIGSPKDTLLCNYHQPLNLFSLLKGNDIQIGAWSPALKSGTSLFDPAQDKSGTYKYTLKGGSQCPTDSLKVKVDVVNVPKTLLGNDTLLCIDSSRTIVATLGMDSYEWQDGKKGASYAVNQAGKYFVTGTRQGCMVTDTLRLAPLNCKRCLFFAPNIFSANDNGTNDVFHLYSDCIPDKFILRIFNRWGDIVFETTDFEAGWNGVFKNRLQNQDIYVFWAEIHTTYRGKPLIEYKKGDFILMH
jgi:gliding motility-associated-like protein